MAIDRQEQALEKSAAELLDVLERQGKLRHLHIPNGGLRSKTEASIMKGMGVRAGFPDHAVLLPPNIEHGVSYPRVALIEFKRPGKQPEGEQNDWRDWLEKNGFDWACVHNLDELCSFLRDLGVMR